MRLLAFDTADEFCTLVLSEKDTRVAGRRAHAGRDQAKILAPLTAELLAEKKWKIADLDRLAICTGPGSFTGLRVGLAFARGMALAAKKPLLGFDHFTCTLHALRRLGKIADEAALVIRDSRRAELFACLSEADEEKGSMFLSTPEQLGMLLRERHELLFTGDAGKTILESFPDLAPRQLMLPAEEIVMSAALLAAHATDFSPYPADPLYLREADVTFPRTA